MDSERRWNEKASSSKFGLPLGYPEENTGSKPKEEEHGQGEL